jgi:outer membrane murein-binding lipoprotein Lpp
MAKASDFFRILASITGNGKAAELEPLLDKLKDIDIPDTIATGINNNILTMESAKNNSTLHDHFNALALNGVDTELERYMNEKNVDPKVAEAIKGEKKTAKRAILLAEKLRELEASKINATGGEKKALQDKIDELSTQVATLNTSVVKEREERDRLVAEAKANFTNELKNIHIDNHFKGYKYANDKIPLSVHTLTAKSLQEQKFKELGLKTAFDPETGEVKLLTTKDQVYYKDNIPVDYKTFTDQLLADNHLLQVKEAAPAAAAQQQQQRIIQPANGRTLNTEAFQAALAESAKTFA